jgi:hypothetical protein
VRYRIRKKTQPAFKRRKVDSARERRALIALITSKPYLMRAAGNIDLELIDAPHFKLVARWCLDYWKSYKKAPGDHIEDIYHSWADGNENEDLIKQVHDFLDGLSRDYERSAELNVPYLLDELRDLMKARKLQRIKEDLEYSLSRGKTEDAERTVLEFKTPPIGEAVGTNPLHPNHWESVFLDPLQPVIEFEGAAGNFFNPALTRDALVMVQAPEKMGKTFWCIEFIMRALRQRRKVAFFEVGDLSQQQVFMRLGVRWAARPLWKGQVRNLRVPNRIVFNSEEKGPGYKVLGKRIKVKGTVTQTSVKRGIQRFQRACGLSSKVDYLKVSVHPSSSINVKGIEGILNQWLLDDGFIPDLIVVDYADILSPEPSKRRYEHDRNVTNDTWKALRRLSQERHALVIVPTQANAKAYSQRLQSMSSFSEDKRKYAHVTACLGLNQTPEEKDMGGMRVNWIVLRGAPYIITRPLYVGQCYALSRALCVAKIGPRGGGRKT